MPVSIVKRVLEVYPQLKSLGYVYGGAEFGMCTSSTGIDVDTCGSPHLYGPTIKVKAG